MFNVVPPTPLQSHAATIVLERKQHRLRLSMIGTLLAALLLAIAHPARGAVVMPDVTWIASPNHNSRGSTIIDAVVMHTTEATYSSTINTFTNPSTEVSSHFVIDTNGHIVQMVDLSRRAWHATYYNSRSIGIEMVGYAGSPATWNDNNLASLVDLLAWLVTEYDIPLVHPTGNAEDYPGGQYDEPGIVAHGQVQPLNRSDPGVYFPWDDVLSRVATTIPEPAAATLLLAVPLLARRRRL